MGVVYTLQVKGVLLEYVVLFYYPKSSSPCVHAWVLGGTSMSWWYVHESYTGGGMCMGPTGGGVRAWGTPRGWWCVYGSWRGGGACIGDS